MLHGVSRPVSSAYVIRMRGPVRAVPPSLRQRLTSVAPMLICALALTGATSASAEVLASFGGGTDSTFAHVAYVKEGKPVGWYGGIGAGRAELDGDSTTSMSVSVSGGLTLPLTPHATMGVGAVYQTLEVDSRGRETKRSDTGIDAWVRPGGWFGNVVLGFRSTREAGTAVSVGWMF